MCFFCASVTVTKENLAYVTGETFLNSLAAHGAKLVFYVEYTPMDESTRSLALDNVDREAMDAKLDTLRGTYKNMIFIAFPGDEKLTGGCLGGRQGLFSHQPRRGRGALPVLSLFRSELKKTIHCWKHWIHRCSRN